MKKKIPKLSAREKLLNSATDLFREGGYAGTSVDALCEKAGVTKGAFFHHFKSKEDLATKVAEYWTATTGQFFAAAPYHKPEDPFDRLIAYIEFRKQILKGKIPEFTCLVGTLVQETYASSESIRAACEESIFSHAKTLEGDISTAKNKYVPEATWSSESLARFFQVTIQGAFILAKASGDGAFAWEALDHLEQYVRLLFDKET